MNEDSLVLSLLQEGQYEEAFSKIVETFSEKLYWHVRSIVLDHDDADDVVQETFLKAWKALPTFRADSGIYTWLYRIATNEALSFLRRKKENVSLDGEGGVYTLAGSDGVDGKKAVTLLERAIGTLPSRQRAVFSLRHFDEMTYECMAAVLGASVGALKASYHFAEEKVKRFIISHSD